MVKDSFVITSRQFGIDFCLHSDFQRLVHPHPKDIRVRSVHMSVPWQQSMPTVKDSFLTELVLRDAW